MEINILQTIDDPNLFKPWFKNEDTWKAWRAFLAALFGLPMDSEQKKIYQTCTKRSLPPFKQCSEAFLVIGRRGGKSFIASLVAVYLACFGNYEKFLTPGEYGIVMLLAADRKQARVLIKYISALLNNIPLLKPLIAKETLESIELTNRLNLEVHTCSYRTTRGYTIVSCVADELSFWRSEDSANPDVEILNSVKPGMATVPGSLLLCLSSPYARKGALWEAYKNNFGKQIDDILVWQAPTRVMNPSVPKRVIDRAMERDAASASAEYMAQFRADIESYISREAVESITVPGRIELPPVPGVRYRAFVDPSGGSADSFALAISHEENGRKVLDCVRETRPPFNPDTVVRDYAQLLERYWLREVTGDRYAGAWVESKFREHRILYKVSEKVKSDLYRELLPLINSGEVELLDNKKLFNQLVSLERRTMRSGKDQIDHPFGSLDDLANSCAGALVSDARKKIAGTWGTPSVYAGAKGVCRYGTI
jgi:hypothetical protein